MFQIHDTVLYGADGVCTITGTEHKAIGGTTATYYVLKPVYNPSSTIFVPTNSKQLLSKMRRILSAAEIREIIRSMPAEDALWIENEAERKARYRTVLASGDRTELVRMIKALYLHQQEQQTKGRKLHLSDERFFKEAEKLLYDEFALVLNIKREQVLPFIMQEAGVEEKKSV